MARLLLVCCLTLINILLQALQLLQALAQLITVGLQPLLQGLLALCQPVKVCLSCRQGGGLSVLLLMGCSKHFLQNCIK